MSIFDLLFILMALGTAGVFLMAIGAVFRRRWVFLERSLGGLLAAWVIYLSAGAVVAMATPQRIQPIGTDRCFDEMCFAVIGFQRTSRIESASGAQAHGIFYIVTVRVSSRSRGKAQHEAGRNGVMIDDTGQSYNVSAEGTKALAAVEGPSPSLETDLNPGETVVAKLVFDLPANVKRPGFVLGSNLVFYPPRIIIADEMHFLHKPTVTWLE